MRFVQRAFLIVLVDHLGAEFAVTGQGAIAGGDGLAESHRRTDRRCRVGSMSKCTASSSNSAVFCSGGCSDASGPLEAASAARGMWSRFGDKKGLVADIGCRERHSRRCDHGARVARWQAQPAYDDLARNGVPALRERQQVQGRGVDGHRDLSLSTFVVNFQRQITWEASATQGFAPATIAKIPVGISCSNWVCNSIYSFRNHATYTVAPTRRSHHRVTVFTSPSMLSRWMRASASALNDRPSRPPSSLAHASSPSITPGLSVCGISM